VLAAWEMAYRYQNVLGIDWKPYVFPAPSHVVDAMANMLNLYTFFGEPLHAGWPLGPVDGSESKLVAGSLVGSPLVQANLISGTRLIIGFVTSIALGGLLGLLMWTFKFLDELLGPLFLGLQTLPSVCWVPLAILTLGINERGIMFVLIMGSFFAVAIALRDGMRTIPPIYQRAGKMLGAHGWKFYRYVLLPASLPALASSLRQGFSFAWRSLMGAELIFMVSNRGVGFLLNIGREFSDVAQVIAVMIVMVGIGMLADKWLFGIFEKRVHSRFGLNVV